MGMKILLICVRLIEGSVSDLKTSLGNPVETTHFYIVAVFDLCLRTNALLDPSDQCSS